jgi:pimeloyl-ACP methyl ester carboxylesterase
MSDAVSDFIFERDGVALSGEHAGEGVPVVLLHGLTATRRYVVMGSRTLSRSGHLVIAYDARGHGRSAPARDAGAYTYEELALDLEAVLAARALPRAVLAGVSMGAHTALRFALSHPELVAALALITPGFDPDAGAGDEALANWDALARGLRGGGVEGFVAAYGLAAVGAPWRELVQTAIRQRMAAHEHPLAVADALEAVPRSRPFEDFDQLAELACPALVIATRDEPDPSHPLALAQRYADALPQASLLVEEEGSSPIAWQGGRISRAIADLAAARAACGHT